MYLLFMFSPFIAFRAPTLLKAQNSYISNNDTYETAILNNFEMSYLDHQKSKISSDMFAQKKCEDTLRNNAQILQNYCRYQNNNDLYSTIMTEYIFRSIYDQKYILQAKITALCVDRDCSEKYLIDSITELKQWYNRWDPKNIVEFDTFYKQTKKKIIDKPISSYIQKITNAQNIALTSKDIFEIRNARSNIKKYSDELCKYFYDHHLPLKKFYHLKNYYKF